MVINVTLYVESIESNTLGAEHANIWSTVRKNGTANELISCFTESATHIATKLKANTSSVSEETAVSMFLIELGLVKLDVLPLSSISKNSKDVIVQETIILEEKLSELENPEEVSPCDKDVNDQPSTSSNGFEAQTCGNIIHDSDMTNSVHDGTSSDTDDYDYDNEYLIDPNNCSRIKDETRQRLPNRRSSRIRKSPLKKFLKVETSTKSVTEKSSACVCHLCSATLSTRKTLIIHLERRHKYKHVDAIQTVKHWYKPKQSGRPKGSQSLRSKRTVKPKYRFACGICKTKYNRRESLQKHMCTMHKITAEEFKEKQSVSTKPFICEICQTDYDRRTLLKKHMCDKHEYTEEASEAEISKVYGVSKRGMKTKLPEKMFYSSEVKQDVSNDDPNVDPTVAFYEKNQQDILEVAISKPTCPKCGKEFDHVSKARIHFSSECTKSPLECELCGNSFTSISGYKVHVAIHKNKQEGKEFKCQTCGKVMHHQYTLSQHEIIHKSNFVCDFCGKSFPQECVLKRHINKHTKEKVFACTECPKVYYLKNEYNRHILDAHSGPPEKLACHVCGKMVNKKSMHVHVTTVHATETFNCTICSKVFKRQGWLNGHMREVHQQGGLTYPCSWPECGKIFTRKRTLKSHTDMHNNVRCFSCQICPKKFRTRNNLFNHTNWHNGVRSHQCSMCNKRFLTKGNLTKHLKTHRVKTDLQ